MNAKLIRGAAIVIVATFAPVCRAQPSVDDDSAAAEGVAQEPAGYREAIMQAVSEYQLGNYEEARSLFARAHELHPNARTLRGLGLTEFELRNYVSCMRYLEEALASSLRPLEGRMRASTEALLRRARGFVARVVVNVSPSGAKLLVDGVPTELDATGALMLQVGDHALEIRKEAYKPERRDLTVHGGERRKLLIELKRDKLSPATERLPLGSPAADEPRRLYKNPWLWMAVGVIAAGAATATVLLLRSDVERRIEPVTTDNTPPGSTLQGLAAW